MDPLLKSLFIPRILEFTLQNQRHFPKSPTIGLLKALVVLERDLRQKESNKQSCQPEEEGDFVIDSGKPEGPVGAGSLPTFASAPKRHFPASVATRGMPFPARVSSVGMHSDIGWSVPDRIRVKAAG
jgi:hypothetical protein